MEMHQIRYFLAVAEHLNFTRAAEACNVSQPSLTRAIKALEDELGGALFHRERNQTHLTELGRSVHPNLAQVFAQTEAAKMLAKDMRTLKAAPLGLGVMCTIGPVRLVEMIRSFHRRHPGVDLTLRDGTGTALQRMLLEGELDAAIYGLPGELDERLHARPLFTERFMVTVAPGHRFERLNAVPLRELAGERYLNRANCEFIAHIRARSSVPAAASATTGSSR
jgi:LysR family transcriptional regulator, hydrogen peroxide-inducible genes activator